jgi:2Fe-2S ferredoxin
MPTLHFISISPDGARTAQDIQARDGRTLMEAAVDAGVKGIAADCGGLLTCATCHVVLPEPWISRVPPITPDEAGMLDFTAMPRQPGSRLSCQITLTPDLNGMTIELPAKQY